MNRRISEIVREFANDTISILKDNLIEEYLFGSYAKNEQSEFSDIDILIIVKKYTLEIQWQLLRSAHYC